LPQLLRAKLAGLRPPEPAEQDERLPAPEHGKRTWSTSTTSSSPARSDRPPPQRERQALPTVRG